MADKANGTGDDSQQGNDTSKSESTFTMEDVNRAITGRFKDFEKKNSKNQVASEKRLLDAIQGLNPAEKQTDGEPDKIESASEDKEKLTNTPQAQPKPEGKSKEMKALEKRFAAIEARAKEAEAKSAKLEADGHREFMRESVRQELRSNGLTDSSRAEHALGYLVDSARMVSAEEGDPRTFNFTNSSGEELSLRDGIASWAQSDDAKIYLPPSGAGGSGSNSPREIGVAFKGDGGDEDTAAALRSLLG